MNRTRFEKVSFLLSTILIGLVAIGQSGCTSDDHDERPLESQSASNARVSGLSSCMTEIQQLLSQTPDSGWIQYDGNHLLLFPFTLPPGGDLSSYQGKCDALGGLIDRTLEVEVASIDGVEYLVCSCEDSKCNDPTDTNPNAATQYNQFGLGTEPTPYRIYTGAQLFSMSRNVNALTGHYELCQDIDLGTFYGSAPGAVYFSIGYLYALPFTGSFEGNDHRIDRFKYTDAATDPNYSNPALFPVMALDEPGVVLRNSDITAALFGLTEGARVSNLTLSNIDIALHATNHAYTGGLIGLGYSSQLENISVNGTIHSLGNVVGGVAGSVGGTLENIDSSVDVRGRQAVGGVAGDLWGVGGNIHASRATGNVHGEDYVGGLVGSSRSTITESYATGNLTVVGSWVGGLVGHCVGVASSVVCHISRSYATGNIQGTVGQGESYGGLVGLLDRQSNVEDCFATGNVTGGSLNGGLIGSVYPWDNTAAPGSIRRSYSTGTVVSGGWYSGGLIGYVRNGVNILDSFVVSNQVQGMGSVGRVVGYSYLTPPTLTNVHYWEGGSCGTPCNGNYGGTSHTDQSYFYSSTNSPLNQWNFGAPWSINEGIGFPYLDL